ncbi:TRAP-type C4-dicarboxylate transport system, small permease component [Avibacterium volantium]|uniref:TRAP transporter small permease protein n=2 Tax=Avibacterium volantium TaxID=762 RepID=A0A447SQ02_AVIVO|nr:TRAP-type C4-dicarboxylate transport system, small permease component [Avibacterium volantium]
MFVRYIERICIGLLIVLFLLLLLEIILRSMFSLSIKWSYEVARVIMIWDVFLGALLLNIKNDHISILLFDNKKFAFVKLIVERIVYLFISVFSIYFLLIIIPFNQVSPTTGLPQWINYLIIPLVFIISLLIRYKEGE